MSIVMTEDQYSLLLKCITTAQIDNEDEPLRDIVKKKVKYSWEVAVRTPGSRN